MSEGEGPRSVMQLKINKILRADLLILLSALLWGGEYVVVKDMVEYLPPNWINSFRFLAVSPVMYLFFSKHIHRLNRRELKAGVLMGVFLFGGFTLQTIGIQYTTASQSGFLTSTYVVIVPFAYWMLRKRFPGIRAIISAVVCIAGIAFISLDENLRMNPGDLLTILAAVSFTGSIIASDYFAKIHNPINLTFVEMLSGGLMSLVLAVIFEPFPSVHLGGFEILQLVYLVLLGTLVCHVISNIAMKTAKSSHASILWSMESVFALIFGIMFLHEQLTGQIAVGFILVFTAVIVSETGSGAIEVKNEQKKRSNRGSRVTEPD
jgi:drug/metabolite transporter (DMT)-like permease